MSFLSGILSFLCGFSCLFHCISLSTPAAHWIQARISEWNYFIDWRTRWFIRGLFGSADRSRPHRILVSYHMNQCQLQLIASTTKEKKRETNQRCWLIHNMLHDNNDLLKMCCWLCFTCWMEFLFENTLSETLKIRTMDHTISI